MGFILLIKVIMISVLTLFKINDSSALKTDKGRWIVSVCDANVVSLLLNSNLLRVNRTEKEVIFSAPEYWMSTNETTNFSLTIFKPKCRSLSERHLELKMEEDVNGTTKHFYPNGYFQHSRHIYAPDEYCIESFKGDSSDLPTITMKFCKPDCSEGRKRACIKKCCPLYQIFRGEPPGKERKPFCEDLPPGSLHFSPYFHHDFYTKVKNSVGLNEDPDDNNDEGVISSEKVIISDGLSVSFPSPFSWDTPLPHFKYQHPKTFRDKCKGGIVLPLPTSERSSELLSQRWNGEYHGLYPVRTRSDGALMFKSLKNKCDLLRYKWDQFCVDGMRGALTDDIEVPFNNTDDEYIIFQCQVGEKDRKLDKYFSSTFGALLLILSVFPLITCIVYILLWKRQNVHGWTIAATSGSLYFTYVFYGLAHVIGVTVHEEALNTFYCQLIGILTHFFMMSTFTWCTVMSCDLWLTFKSVVPMNQQRIQGVSRYLKYSVFGWGVPSVIVITGILMDFVISTSTDCSFLPVPAYGQESCWIVEGSTGEYLYYPGLLLICINICLFTATCVKLCMYGKGPAGRSRRNDAFGECFSRFTKLFCVMGISWIFEILSWYIDGFGFVWYWNVLDLFNILRAVVMFVIYVCKKDIIHQLEDTYPSLKHIFRPFSRLILRKCSDELSVESTAISAAVVTTATASSPGIPLKATNCSRGNNKSPGIATHNRAKSSK